MGEGDTLTNAAIGAAVAIVLAIVPLSPALGGGVAGYLQRGPVGEGVKVGAIAGLLTMVPFVLLVLLLTALVPLAPGQATLPVAAFLVAVVLFVASYAVGLAVLGGAVGSVLAAERADADVPV